MLTHLSLCSGIGGLDLAAEWAGFETVGQCEIDDFASAWLAKNFKGVHNFYDIRTVNDDALRICGIDPEEITVMSAGFPCQPYSLAGKGLGDGDSRDLWGEVSRCIGELRPRWFVGENTPGLFARADQRYFKRILADLAALGYRVSWGIWGACDVGAPHERKRVFICARNADGEHDETQSAFFKEDSNACGICRKISDALGERFDTSSVQRRELAKGRRAENKGRIQSSRVQFVGIRGSFSDAPGERYGSPQKEVCTRRHGAEFQSQWQVEPDVGRVADGVSDRVDRLRCLGNAVVPYQALPIFEAIAAYEMDSKE